MRHSSNIRIDVLDVGRKLFRNFNKSFKHSQLLDEWQTKFGSEIFMKITVWSRPAVYGSYMTQGRLFDGDVLVAYTDTEIDKIVGEYSANWGGHEYVVNVNDSMNKELPSSTSSPCCEIVATESEQRQPAIKGTGPYLVVVGDALKGFEFYGPFKTAEQATNFNKEALEFPGLIASFEECGLDQPEPAFSGEECALVLRADMICTSLGNVAADAAGKESYHKLSREFSRLRMKMITTNK